MSTQLAVDANFNGVKSPPQTDPTATKLDKPPKLPGLDSPKFEKDTKAVFSKFKVKITFTVPEHDEIKSHD
eukprot:7967270-Ditylum_brightwellii.AAC.1